jgi:hypothetical protein
MEDAIRVGLRDAVRHAADLPGIHAAAQDVAAAQAVTHAEVLAEEPVQASTRAVGEQGGIHSAVFPHSAQDGIPFLAFRQEVQDVTRFAVPASAATLAGATAPVVTLYRDGSRAVQASTPNAGSADSDSARS